MKNKLVILCGISNSGKSTFASRIVQYNPDRYVIVNRDKIRELLFGYTESNISEYYLRNDIGKLEKRVSDLENSLIHKYLREDLTVIVDATHLKVKYLNKYTEFLVDREIIFFDILLKESLIRNSDRLRNVSKDVITKQHEDYININKFLISNKLKYDYIATKLNNYDL